MNFLFSIIMGFIIMFGPAFAQSSYMDPENFITYKDSTSGILYSLDRSKMADYLYRSDEVKTDPAAKKITENELSPGPRLLELYRNYFSTREDLATAKMTYDKTDKDSKPKDVATYKKNYSDAKSKFNKAEETYFNMLYEFPERTDVNPVIQILSLAQLQILAENYYYGAKTKEAEKDFIDIIEIYTKYKSEFFPDRIKQMNKRLPSDRAEVMISAVDAEINKKMEGKRPSVTSGLDKKSK